MADQEETIAKPEPEEISPLPEPKPAGPPLKQAVIGVGIFVVILILIFAGYYKDMLDKLDEPEMVFTEFWENMQRRDFHGAYVMTTYFFMPDFYGRLSDAEEYWDNYSQEYHYWIDLEVTYWDDLNASFQNSMLELGEEIDNASVRTVIDYCLLAYTEVTDYGGDAPETHVRYHLPCVRTNTRWYLHLAGLKAVE